MPKFVRKFTNLEKPGLTNGTDSFVEWYEEKKEETPIQQEETNED
jgi:hypothetical protein